MSPTLLQADQPVSADRDDIFQPSLAYETLLRRDQAVQALRGIKLGTVPYLNAKPLTHGLDDQLLRAHPSRLATMLRAGEVQGALVPVAEAIEASREYDIVDGIGVAARGPVYSVFLVLHRPVAEVRTVALDPASKTSALLTRVLLAGRGVTGAVIVPFSTAEVDARLLIGDQAIAYRAEHPQASYLDLGEEWLHQTGLPFVFAAWVLRRDSRNAEIADHLRTIAIAGLRAVRDIARNEEEYVYLTEHIEHRIGGQERRGAALFAEKLVSLGLVPPMAEPLHWI